MATKLPELKTSISLLNLVKFWDQLNFRWALKAFFYPWVVKKSFVEDWVGVAILAVMGQCRFLIQRFFLIQNFAERFFFYFLNKKKLFLF